MGSSPNSGAFSPESNRKPLKTFEEPVHLSGAGKGLPKTYIYCTRPAPGDIFRQFADRARSERGWRYFEIDASHSPHITAPDALATLLDKIAAGSSAA